VQCTLLIGQPGESPGSEDRDREPRALIVEGVVVLELPYVPDPEAGVAEQPPDPFL
jgi:hypothetical protein